jgi:carboxyl-terminal processing protease
MKSKFVVLFITASMIIPSIHAKEPTKKLAFFDSTQSAKEKDEERKKEIFQWFRTLSEVTHLIEKKHFRDVDFSDFIQNALQSALPKTDAHSSFFPQKLYKSTLESTSGEFSGIGVSIMNKAPEDESLIVIDVISNGPSDKAGLKSGDKIVEVEGEALKGMSSDEIITKLKGKTGTKLSIKVIRKKKPLEFKITRDIIKDESALCYHFKNQNVSYLSLKIFADNAAQQLGKLILKAQKHKGKGIVLDLRRNPGGVLESAVEMASLFVDKGSLIVSTKDNKQKVVSKYYTHRNPVLDSDLPIFILIDNFTASAAEILSGALKHYSDKISNDARNKRNLMVFLVGTETFGKGSVQEVIPISNGCALKITTMLYYLPDDTSIQAKGISPDFVINPKTIPSEEIKWVTELYGKESSLKNHISVNEVQGKPEDKEKKKEEEKEELSWEERHQKAISHDVQIQACVNMINLLDIAKKSNPKMVENRQKALVFLKNNYLTDEDAELEKIK